MIKKFTMLLISLITMATADRFAVTDDGRQVILYSDGKWKWIDTTDTENRLLDTLKISKPKTSTFLLKGAKVNYGIWLETLAWKFEKVEQGSAEYFFSLRGKDAFGISIAEQGEVPLEGLKDFAVESAKRVSPDAKVITSQYRMVNGALVLFIEIERTINGAKFRYLGYYYSSKDGIVQVITYTFVNLIELYRKDMENFLNGFVILAKN